jgi:hypothetical protein
MTNRLTLSLGAAMAGLILLCLLFGPGCKKDILQPNAGVLDNPLSIAEAKQYFDANLKQLAKSKKLMGTTPGTSGQQIATLEDVKHNKQPIWEKAYQMMISSGTSVKIPIDFNQTLAVVGSKKDVMPMSSLNYLLMYRDSLQQIHAEWVFLKPDSSWLYGSRDTYHGEVYVSDWNGKPIKKLSFPPQASLNRSSKTSGGSHGKLMSVAEEPILVPGGSISICIRYRTGVCTCTSGPCDWMTCNVCGVTSCGKNLTVWVIDDKFPDGPDKPPTQGGGGESPSPGNGIGGGGTPNPNDYVPLNCNPDPNYVDPHIVNADGSMSVPACSDIPVPTCGNCPPPGPTLPQVLSSSQFLTLALGLQPYETTLKSFIDNSLNEPVIDKMVAYLDNNGGNTQENVGFLRWSINYLIAEPNTSLGLLDNIYDAIRYQNTTPRDREPASYHWRPILTNSDGSDNFSSLTETTPRYTYPNGVKTINLDAFNCHYHTFGLQYAKEVDDENPKWVYSVSIKGKDWEQVTGNIKVGDRVMYYKEHNGNVGWTHSALVIEVDADGYATKVSSKMGTYQIIEHHPRDIPASYGSPSPTFAVGSGTHPSRIYWRKK